MNGPLPRPLTALVLALALGSSLTARQPLTHAAWAYNHAQEPQRTSLAKAQVMGLRASLGLGTDNGFVPVHTFTNESGETVVRLDHTFRGSRVLGSQAIAHVPLGGTIRTNTRFVLPDPSLTTEPTLSPETAQAIVLHQLAPKGALKAAPKVERVVFPAQFVGGTATSVDPATGETHLNRRLSVHANLSDPFAWAYEVKVHLDNPQDGVQLLTAYVDARTGAVLRINDAMEHQAVPTAGTGQGYYNGPVSIPTSQMSDGTYALLDPTRGMLPNPGLQWSSSTAPDWSPTGMQVWYEQNDASGNNTWQDFLHAGNPTNSWGDGQPFTQYGNEGGANGQTMGVDAMFGMATTWDFFQNIFYRNGLDNLGTSVFAEVGLTDSYYRNNASFNPWNMGLYLGTGTPDGLGSFTELGVVAHEMTHGVTSSTANFVNSPGYEEAGLNEGTSDFFAQMALAYASAPGTSVPDTGTTWTMGEGLGHGKPLRWLNKPSKDQRSVDAWYDGILYMDGHYSAGVLNRALFFLSHGASSTPGADDFSPYLPQGMPGIGNDKAARIWYKAVTEYLYSGGMGQVTFLDARNAAIQAALYLYGDNATGWGNDSLTAHAVENAFGAVNVGLNYAEASRTQVLFANWRNHDWIERAHSPGLYGNRQFLPVGERVKPRITVLNNPNTAVTWSLGGPSLYNGSNNRQGGVINADGSWTTPYELGWYAITATSQADPKQFAEGRAFLVNLDTDQDNEQDAVDLGNIAFSWYLTNGLNPAHSLFNAPWVDDGDVAAFADAMKATWWVK